MKKEKGGNLTLGGGGTTRIKGKGTMKLEKGELRLRMFYLLNYSNTTCYMLGKCVTKVTILHFMTKNVKFEKITQRR